MLLLLLLLLVVVVMLVVMVLVVVAATNIEVNPLVGRGSESEEEMEGAPAALRASVKEEIVVEDKDAALVITSS